MSLKIEKFMEIILLSPVAVLDVAAVGLALVAQMLEDAAFWGAGKIDTFARWTRP